MANRITASVERARQRIKSRLESGEVDQATLDGLDKSLNMEPDEHATFQNLKNVAMMNGMMTAEEAQSVYVYLGETAETFNRQEIAVKSTLTQLFHELLESRLPTQSAAMAG